MATAELREELYCSICLEVFTDPVTLRCGHNFCRNCIECVLSSQERSGVYACPDCREEFQDRSALYRNITLRNIAERFLAATEEDAATFCAYCTDSKVPAVKSCLHCNAMLCNKHLEIHSKAPENALPEPSDCLKAPKCSIHRQIFKYYCADDSVCICATCLTSEHRGHQAEDIDKASEKKKATLRNILEILTLKEADVEKRLQGLEEHQADVQAKASSEKKRVAALLGDVVRQIGDLQTRVLNEITGQEEKMSMTVSGQIHQMASKKDTLHKNMRYIEELCNKADALTILQEHITDYGNTEEGDMEDGDGDDQQVHDKGDLDGARSSEMVLAGLYGIINVVKEKLHSQKASGLLLNVATAANNIKISDDLKGVISIKEEEDRPETPLRFQKFQVVSTQSFSSGRHYWEVLTSESGGWRVGMTYPSIQREGAKSAIGENDKSWCLRTFHGNYAVRHCGIDHCLARKVLGCRFRISLDYEAGQLSFYGLGNPVTHLYTFTTTFTEPLHAALYVMGGKAWVRITS